MDAVAEECIRCLDGTIAAREPDCGIVVLTLSSRLVRSQSTNLCKVCVRSVSGNLRFSEALLPREDPVIVFTPVACVDSADGFEVLGADAWRKDALGRDASTLAQMGGNNAAHEVITFNIGNLGVKPQCFCNARQFRSQTLRV